MFSTGWMGAGLGKDFTGAVAVQESDELLGGVGMLCAGGIQACSNQV